jgi:MSHA biogenesis protein MshJ
MNMISTLRERFQILTSREKFILTTTVAIVLWSAWDRSFWSPLKQQENLLLNELSNLNQQLSVQQQTATKLQGNSAADPKMAIKFKLTQLNSELTRLQNHMALEGEKFVPPRLMAKVLNDLLNQNQQLLLIKLDTLPVTTLRTEKNQFFPVYKHGLILTFSGVYSDTLTYLKSIESLPWRITWDSIEYQVKNYPLAETTIRAYTLSFEESWLGV